MGILAKNGLTCFRLSFSVLIRLFVYLFVFLVRYIYVFDRMDLFS